MLMGRVDRNPSPCKLEIERGAVLPKKTYGDNPARPIFHDATTVLDEPGLDAPFEQLPDLLLGNRALGIVESQDSRNGTVVGFYEIPQLVQCFVHSLSRPPHLPRYSFSDLDGWRTLEQIGRASCR